jgi:hypothetical protein
MNAAGSTRSNFFARSETRRVQQRDASISFDRATGRVRGLLQIEQAVRRATCVISWVEGA